MTLDYLKARQQGLEQDVVSTARAVARILKRHPGDVEWCAGVLERAIQRLDEATAEYNRMLTRLSEVELEDIELEAPRSDEWKETISRAIRRRPKPSGSGEQKEMEKQFSGKE